MVALLLSPPHATAKLCGDDVEGEDVPCDCGDTIASDVSLDDDPVVSASCPSDALIVRAPEAAESIDIDLAGHTLRGAGSGVGLWVLHGGPGGARIVSTGGPATIEGFRDGVVSHGQASVAMLEGVVVRHSGRDGVRLFDVMGAMIRDVETVDSGRDGFSLMGKEFTLANTRAVSSQRHGYHLMGGGGVIGQAGAGNTAEDSGGNGFSVMGMGHRFVECVATGSGGDGVKLAGMHYEITGCEARENGGDGIGGRGMAWRLAGNRAIDNDKNGILVSGTDVADDGGNFGAGNRGLDQHTAPVQCEIGGSPCAP
jgi:hypothetical protein